MIIGSISVFRRDRRSRRVTRKIGKKKRFFPYIRSLNLTLAPVLQHMAAYSPISCRSTRTSALSWRRRDSMNSSAGASSVRRLIAAVRAAPSGPRPPRKAVLRHIAALLLGHASCSAATLPIFPLQAGLGAFEPHVGPMLLAQLYMMAAVTSCFAPIVIQRLGTNLAITASHLVTAIFVGVHLYPKWYDIKRFGGTARMFFYQFTIPYIP